MNAHDTVRQLNNFYTTAVYTGTADPDTAHHYAYIADEIHKTIRLIITGHDPVSCQTDLVNVLKADANEMPDSRYRNITVGWAYALEGATTNA